MRKHLPILMLIGLGIPASIAGDDAPPLSPPSESE